MHEAPRLDVVRGGSYNVGTLSKRRNKRKACKATMVLTSFEAYWGYSVRKKDSQVTPGVEATAAAQARPCPG